MDLRMLEYFLAVAREQNITAAAESLHISQPALSTQLKAMEAEFGKQLLIRGTKGSRKVILTEEGMILRKRAEEILSLMRRTEEEISGSDETIAGNVYVGTGETEIVRLFAKIAKQLQKNIRISVTIFPAATRNMFWIIWIKESVILVFFLRKSTRANTRPFRFP